MSKSAQRRAAAAAAAEAQRGRMIATQAPTKLAAGAEQPPLPRTAPEGTQAPRGVDQFTVSTFRDLGRYLPIGYLQGGQLHRPFAFRRYSMKEERELEEIKAKNSAISMADFVGAVMAHMLTSLGPWPNFGDLGETERRLIVSQMFLADVMYAYIQLRIEVIGPDISFDLKCPRCRHRWAWSADLTGTDVVVAEQPDHLVWKYTLRDALTTPRGEVKTLLLQPPRWYAMTGRRTREGESPNMGDVKLNLIASAVRQAGDQDGFAIGPEALEGLSKYDLERLSKSIDGDTPGADLELSSKCPECGCEFSHALNWSWDFFFGGSSL